MPYNKFGIRPDIILNPNAIPSRQTIGQLLESLVGKVAALEGFEGDGTPFEDYDLEKVENRLKELGYDPKGYEELYNGMTGEKLKIKIYFGPTFYQRLKHQVEDKIHARARGPRTLLTRQPPEGQPHEAYIFH
jgi:DNA-directed RNA polymerase II subunit RPB2